MSERRSEAWVLVFNTEEVAMVRSLGVIELLIIMGICCVPAAVAAGVAAWLVIKNRNKS
jgi:hypothetical protein